MRLTNSFGLGDILLRLKGTVARGEQAGLALGVDVRLPSGDELDLLGIGTYGIKPFAAVPDKRISPHFNLGYQHNGESLLAGDTQTSRKGDFPDQILYVAGADLGIRDNFTVALDHLGQDVINSKRIATRSFLALDDATTFPTVQVVERSLNVLGTALGFNRPDHRSTRSRSR